jgi:peptidyl-dipeptidase Dcp
LFHEFGRFTRNVGQYNPPSLSGTSVYWDFVELPSSNGKLVLRARSFSNIRNALPNRRSPDGICKQNQRKREFQEGLATMRQLSFGLLDMGWHGQDPTAITDVKL